jgi:DNA-directed RNA polymerase subunit RPC12/RpoP
VEPPSRRLRLSSWWCETLLCSGGVALTEPTGSDEGERPRETTERVCPYCGSRDVSPTGGASQVGIGDPWKEGWDCHACKKHFRRIRMPS